MMLVKTSPSMRLTVLEDDAELLPHGADVEGGQVLAVVIDRPASRPLEAEQQPEDRRFARAGWADQRDELARPRLDAHVLRTGGPSGS